MFDLEEKVAEVRLYKNAIMYNSHHDRNYRVLKYAEIEFFNGNIIKLDIDSGTDITTCDYLEIVNKGKLVKTIFKSNLLGFGQ